MFATGSLHGRICAKVKSHMEDFKPKSRLRVSDGRLRLTENDSKGCTKLDVQESGEVTFGRNMTSKYSFTKKEPNEPQI